MSVIFFVYRAEHFRRISVPVLGGGRPDPWQDSTCVQDRSQRRRIGLDNSTPFSTTVHFKLEKLGNLTRINFLCARVRGSYILELSCISCTTNRKREFKGGNNIAYKRFP